MATRKYTKNRKLHPGVRFKARRQRSGETIYRAVFIDPDTERETYVTLDPLALRTVEARRAWAVDKAQTLATRRAELSSGAVRKSGMALDDAIDRYFDAHLQLRPRTTAIYRSATDKFEAWGAKNGVTSSDDLTRAKLLVFREHLIAQPKRAPRKLGKRGTWSATGEPRGAAAVNQDLRALGTVLRYLHELDLLPRTSFDDLRRGLRLVKAGRDAPEFLAFNECRQLLQSAMLHDSATFTETRDEHAGPGRKRIGKTKRYPAVAPLVATTLLTGMRVGEALGLRWSWVHLDTRDSEGRLAGEIRLPSEATKTKQGRTVSLDVCPALRTLLVALKAQAGDADFVFGGKRPMTREYVEGARKRLLAK